MPNALALLPWVHVDETKEIGPVRLLPFRWQQLPGDLTHIAQTDIDGIFSAYADRPNHPIERGTILEIDDWHAGMDAPDGTVNKLFRVRNMLAFAALSQRELFRQHVGYCNSDTYTLVVQRFRPGDTGTFAFETRRRDGGTSQLWGSDEFAFHRPNHVDGKSRIALDESLLATLLSLPNEHTVYSALQEFNSANTDSRDVPEHVEVVMSKSALEWLFGIGPTTKELVNALQRLLKETEPAAADGPLKAKWRNRWPAETRPLHAWARDFCAVRGTSAHGMSRGPSNFVWQDRQHLAFIAVLFPLLLKKVLADKQLFKLDGYDLERLRRIDEYLLHDPFGSGSQPKGVTHPWVGISQRSLNSTRTKAANSEAS